MRVFVSGATGFAGSAVVKGLLSSGRQVTGLSRAKKAPKRSTGSAQRRAWESLASLLCFAGRPQSPPGSPSQALSHMGLAARFRLFAGALNGGLVSSFVRILPETETGAVQALGAGLDGSGRPPVVTSARVLFLLAGRVSGSQGSLPIRTPSAGWPWAPQSILTREGATRGRA